MSTENENVTTEEVEVQVLAGDLLRKKREELGLSQQEIADRLRLRLSVIQSIDDNNLDFDHVATFTRGYLRSYAKAVSLDEKLVLNAIDGVGDAQHAPQSMQSFSRKTKRDKHDSRIMKLTVVIVIAIFGISSVWWYQNRKQDTLEETSPSEATEVLNISESPVAEPEVITPAVVEEKTETAEEVASEPAQPEAEIIEAEQPVVSEPVAQEVAVEEEQTAEPEVISEPEPVVATNNTLSMNFSADCWVQVKDATGKTLVTGVKKAGRNLTVEGQLPYSIVLGAPEAVSMRLASEPVDLSGYTSGKVARFTLP
ncbi:cytoskeleton protein RodZ [Vibrio sp. JC009]|uniref:cytoskeleton protein RodZ n=1 Tax=Vibrio sp. JC009 TaxID=2912314 RepID=UPI0023AF24A4|nr:cytoskeleton protein RodZ [Vibrio sp. JC009]WED21343.1 cytoskeleton protein RodZ [Vibrio sp. JC009]